MQIGPYTVLEQIASGGQGVVFRAQGPDGRPVALKVLRDRAATGPSARKRFAIEVGALARLRHPHVVSILGAGEHEGCPWLALEFVEGESLQERLRRGGPLPVDEAIELATQLAQALSYVHACGVLHRDLKPDNVLLRKGAALLTDFGLARDEDFAESRLSRTGVLMGTPGYWAPEQAQGDKHAIGETTDVYGLGAVLYACLTGRAPVEADSLQAHLEPQRVQQIPAPRVLRSEVPHWLSQLCARCLSEAPRDRPPSVEAVARALLTAGE
ncbi:MAG: serine/threonine protein kinase, partial [Planctomycetes bacterium]|nr:serine/threonine protein kinase [Planctomycetota bacterium]